MRCIISAVLALLLAACSTSGVPLPPHTGDVGYDETFLTFSDAAFQPVDGEDTARGIMRWKRGAELRVCTHNASPAVAAHVESTLRDFQGLTGLRPRRTCTDPNVNMYFYGRRLHAERSRANTVCEASYWAKVRGHIFEAEVYIRGDIAEKGQRQCVVEELLHAVGLGETERQFDTLLFDFSYATEELYPMDRLILWIFYHPRLRPGMTKEQAAPIVSALINEAIDKSTPLRIAFP